jgi:exosortase
MRPSVSISLGERINPWLFLLSWIVVLLAFWEPVQEAFSLSLQNELYSHLVLIPLVSVALIYFRREAIFHDFRRVPGLVIPLLVLAATFYWLAWPWSQPGARSGQLLVPILAIVVLWASAFLVFNGPKASVAALFPLCFLVLMVPIPTPLLEHVVVMLQKSSADVAFVLFKVLGVPVLRHGFQFSLPGLEIEVAQECSGIRSAVALLIAGMLTAHLLLQTTWKQILFTLLTIPVAVFKNGVRIVILSYLGLYVDRRILDGPLHHQGGAVFALLGLAMLLPFLVLLRRSESPRKREAGF